MFLDDFLNHVDTLVGTYTFEAYGALASALTPAFVTLYALLITIWGYKIYMGTNDHTPLYYVKQGFMVLLVGAFALNWDLFSSLVVHTVMDLPDAFIPQLISREYGDADSMNSIFEHLYVSANHAFSSTTEEAGWRNMGSV